MARRTADKTRVRAARAKTRGTANSRNDARPRKSGTATVERPALPDVPPMDPDLPYAFLICSFGDEPALVAARREGIGPTLAAFGMPVYRVDEIPSTSPVIDATRHAIEQADVVIADLSGARPNCYYEVGYAHAIGRQLVHLIHESEHPEFNVAGLRFVRYRDPQHLRALLTEHMLRHVLTNHEPADAEDPHCGAFGRRSFVAPYMLSGRVSVDREASQEHEIWFAVEALVRSVDPRRPLKGDVSFYLHPSFPKQTRRVRAKHGIARLTDTLAYGAWTLGAVVHHTNTRLELNLARLPGAGTEFRNR